jgi:hypothetical protein
MSAKTLPSDTCSLPSREEVRGEEQGRAASRQWKGKT